MRNLKLALLAALTASMALMSPVAAHATMHPSYATFTGYTYTGDAVGLAACNAAGSYILDNSGGNYQNWRCELNNPVAGMYGLYMVTIPCYPECGAKPLAVRTG